MRTIENYFGYGGPYKLIRALYGHGWVISRSKVRYWSENKIKEEDAYRLCVLLDLDDADKKLLLKKPKAAPLPRYIEKEITCEKVLRDLCEELGIELVESKRATWLATIRNAIDTKAFATFDRGYMAGRRTMGLAG